MFRAVARNCGEEPVRTWSGLRRTSVVLAVFHFPVAAVAGQQIGGVGLPASQAGNPVHGFRPAQRIAVQVADLAVDAEGLEHAGEGQARHLRAGPDGADLGAAVAAVKGDVMRGKARSAGPAGNSAAISRSRDGMLPFTVTI